MPQKPKPSTRNPNQNCEEGPKYQHEHNRPETRKIDKHVVVLLVRLRERRSRSCGLRWYLYIVSGYVDELGEQEFGRPYKVWCAIVTGGLASDMKQIARPSRHNLVHGAGRADRST